MAISNAPTQVRIHAYQVGFGDCFLLTFRYGKEAGERDRHVLIDFGSSETPSRLGADLMTRVAADIRQECGGSLDMVVASHRHSDHVSGFTQTKKGDGPGDIIRQCKPRVVLQPWTEDPEAQPNDREPTKTLPAEGKYLRALTGLSGFSQALLGELSLLRPGLGKQLTGQLAFIGSTNLPNLSAVTNLMTMGKGRFYLYALSKVDLQAVLPGVKIHVLGPPTLKQSNRIAQQRSSDEAEFWLRMAALDSGPAGSGRPAFRGPRVKTRPAYANWLIPRLQASRGEGLLELVRMLDKQMNNTSLILLFEVGNQKLLFPGDAQIENWSYVLDLARKSQPGLRKLLEGVTFYKVGHHGSRNATPKTLWNMFRNRGKPGKPGRLITVASTMAGKHGNSRQGTEVPRATLVEALSRESDYSSTQELTSKKKLRLTFELDAK